MSDLHKELNRRARTKHLNKMKSSLKALATSVRIMENIIEDGEEGYGMSLEEMIKETKHMRLHLTKDLESAIAKFNKADIDLLIATDDEREIA